jgi:hypothetical protein
MKIQIGSTTYEFAQQVDPYGNDAGDEHRATWCEACADTHYRDEHTRTELTAPELATLRTAIQLTTAGPAYTDRYLVGRTIAARGIPDNADNRRHYRDHISTLLTLGLLERPDLYAVIDGSYDNTIDATTAAYEHIRNHDRSTR